MFRFQTRQYIFCGLLLLVCIWMGNSVSAQPIYINELMASNTKTRASSHRIFSDWVEIYNASEWEINLEGMYFTDDPEDPTKWQIPIKSPSRAVLPPNTYKIVWFDRRVRKSQLHATFTLKKKSGYLALYGLDGETLLDSVSWGEQYADISWGRSTDGSKKWQYFSDPTPKKANKGEKITKGPAADPVFSVIGGLYDSQQTIAIEVPKGQKVYVTMDGSLPKAKDSLLYKKPFQVNATTPVRAQNITSGYFPSKVITQTYFIKETSTLPVVSFVTDPDFLWDKHVGMYLNWEKKVITNPAHLEYFTKEGKREWNIDLKFKIFGQTSKKFAKKSFRLKTDDAYGAARLEYPLFEDRNYSSFQDIILRADATNGKGGHKHRETTGDRVKNELIYRVNKELGYPVDIQGL